MFTIKIKFQTILKGVLGRVINPGKYDLPEILFNREVDDGLLST
jgi:hypothetical protein